MNWQAEMDLLELTQDQVNQVTVKIVEEVEKLGGRVAGGFVPAGKVKNGKKEPKTVQIVRRLHWLRRAAWWLGGSSDGEP